MNWTTKIMVMLTGIGLAASASAAPTIHPTGVTINEPGLVTAGVVVYTAQDSVVRAIGLNGGVLASWTSPFPDTDLEYARPLPNGHILARVGPDDDRMVELDKAGNVIWDYQDAEGRLLHHDQNRLPNGNYLLLCSRLIDVPAISSQTLEDDCVIEVDRDGNVVWEWQTADHFDDFDFTDDRKQQIFDTGDDWAHANAAYAIPPNTSHADPRFRPGNIIISYRFISQVVVVDRDTGDIVWRSDGITIGQHDAQMLPDSAPGGGNILVFDNGNGGYYVSADIEVWRYWSRVVEIDPNTGSIVWEYSATSSGRPPWTFFSWFISSAQRMPNGNTFIDEGAFGRMFEVAEDGQIVWEYVSPVTNPDHQRFPGTNHAYRGEKVSYDWVNLGQ